MGSSNASQCRRCAAGGARKPPTRISAAKLRQIARSIVPRGTNGKTGLDCRTFLCFLELLAGGSLLFDTFIGTDFHREQTMNSDLCGEEGGDDKRVSTGIAGLDDVLFGGLDPDRLYLVEGEPGTGKTTLALQFLLNGAREGEKGLYVTLSESERELRLVGARHGWSLDAISIFELIPPEASLDPERELTLFHPAEMELSETSKLIFDQVSEIAPVRVVFDSLSEIRLLAQNPLRYRRQILALKHFFSGRKCTVLLLDDMSSVEHALQLHSIAHGVIVLEQLALEYGSERRRLRVAKMRGISFRGGHHDFNI